MSLLPTTTYDTVRLAQNYAFRDAQSTVASLGNRAKYNERGDVTISNFSVSCSAVDSVPPSVAITSPIAGSTVAGTVTVSAVASDNVGVVGVQFLVDGTLLGNEDLNEPYSATLSSSGFSNSLHSLTALIRDGSSEGLADVA